MLTVGSLFAGIGGFDLGFERTGHMQTVWFCEQDPFCQRVLAKHWPGVPVYPDVRALVANAGRGGVQSERGPGGVACQTNGSSTRSDAAAGGEGEGPSVPVPVPHVDVLCGGFPCQDISLAGSGAGLAGERSGLWREFARLIGELRPRYVIVENVPALTVRGLDRVLADLAACGFDAEWDHLPASAFGAPHRRDRIWLVAYPDSPGGEARCGYGVGTEPRAISGQPSRPGGAAAPDAERPGLEGQRAVAGQPQEPESGNGRALADAARDAETGRAAQAGTVGERARPGRERSGAHDVGDPDAERRGGGIGNSWESQSRMGDLANGLPTGLGGHWDREPDIGRIATGVPERVNKLRALGNALVPQIAEWIGRQIIEWEHAAAMREAA